MKHRVRAIIDPTVPAGRYRIGGVRIVHVNDDAALGREIRTVEVGCHDAAGAWRLREIVEADEALEMADDSVLQR
jgi:hypothetical protein